MVGSMSSVQELVDSGASDEEIVAFVLDAAGELTQGGPETTRSSAEIGERMMEQDLSPSTEYDVFEELQRLTVRGVVSMDLYRKIWDAANAQVSGPKPLESGQ